MVDRTYDKPWHAMSEMHARGRRRCAARAALNMIRNSLCPYCLVPMVKAENQPNSQSVEHLIPNAALTKKRSNEQGDFYACRECNSKKSKVDELIGALAKGQSSDEEMAAAALIKVVARHERLPERFARMLSSVEHHPDGVHVEMPITGKELVEYLTFLGKGVYFKKYRKPYVESRQVMILNFFNKQVHSAFKSDYQARHGSDPIRDLEANLRSEVIAPGESVIWSMNSRFFIVLHDYMSVGIEFKMRNRKNEARARARVDYLLSSFG